VGGEGKREGRIEIFGTTKEGREKKEEKGKKKGEWRAGYYLITTYLESLSHSVLYRPHEKRKGKGERRNIVME